MKIKINSRFVLILFVFTISYILHTTYCLYAQDRIVAIVNNEVITQKDLGDFLNFMRLQLSKEYKGKELEEKMQEAKISILSKLVEDRLILQEAKKNNIIVDQARVRLKIDEVKKEYPSDRQFQDELMKQGLTQGDIEKKIQEQFMMFSIVEQKVRSKITIKPEEVTEFYEINKKDIVKAEARNFEALSLEDYNSARIVAKELKAGKNAEDLASRFTLTVNRLTLNSRDDFKKEITDAVYKLGINEVSEPVKLDERYYVFRLIAVTGPEELTLTQAQAKIHSFLFERKMQEGLARWLNELKKNSYIKIMQD